MLTMRLRHGVIAGLLHRPKLTVMQEEDAHTEKVPSLQQLAISLKARDMSMCREFSWDR
jgi:hypothetical protein